MRRRRTTRAGAIAVRSTEVQRRRRAPGRRRNRHHRGRGQGVWASVRVRRHREVTTTRRYGCWCLRGGRNKRGVAAPALVALLTLLRWVSLRLLRESETAQQRWRWRGRLPHCPRVAQSAAAVVACGGSAHQMIQRGWGAGAVCRMDRGRTTAQGVHRRHRAAMTTAAAAVRTHKGRRFATQRMRPSVYGALVVYPASTTSTTANDVAVLIASIHKEAHLLLTDRVNDVGEGKVVLLLLACLLGLSSATGSGETRRLRASSAYWCVRG